MALSPQITDLSPQVWPSFLAEVLPPQGCWTDEEYLVLTEHSNRLIEFTDGYLEELPMPTDRHQAIVQFLSDQFRFFIDPRGGKVRFAPLRLRIRPGKFREPDLLLLLSADDPRRENRYWEGADLTAEVVSPDKEERDLVEERGDYAEGGVPEYWIVNPRTETITVLKLEDGRYVEAGVYRRGEIALSPLLSGFSLNVDNVFDAD